MVTAEFEPGGVIGRHPAVGRQALAVITGAVEVWGGDGHAVDLAAGQLVLFEPGEEHETRAITPATVAIMEWAEPAGGPSQGRTPHWPEWVARPWCAYRHRLRFVLIAPDFFTEEVPHGHPTAHDPSSSLCVRSAPLRPRSPGAAGSTGARLALAYVRCLFRHWFLMPVDQLDLPTLPDRATPGLSANGQPLGAE